MRARHLAVRLLHVRPRIACPSRPRRNQLVHGRRRGRQGAHRATHARCSGARVGRSCCGARRRARGRVHTLARTMARESQAVSSRLHVCATRMTPGACAAANDEIAHNLRRKRGRRASARWAPRSARAALRRWYARAAPRERTRKCRARLENSGKRPHPEASCKSRFPRRRTLQRSFCRSLGMRDGVWHYSGSPERKGTRPDREVARIGFAV